MYIYSVLQIFLAGDEVVFNACAFFYLIDCLSHVGSRHEQILYAKLCSVSAHKLTFFLVEGKQY
jgi:hypothetical protein